MFWGNDDDDDVSVDEYGTVYVRVTCEIRAVSIGKRKKGYSIVR